MSWFNGRSGTISGSFEERFFPEMVDLRRRTTGVRRSVQDGHQRRENFRRWREMGEAIDVQFREIDAA